MNGYQPKPSLTTRPPLPVTPKLNTVKQIVRFDSTSKVNDWLLKYSSKVVDIQTVATQHTVYYIIIYNETATPKQNYVLN